MAVGGLSRTSSWDPDHNDKGEQCIVNVLQPTEGASEDSREHCSICDSASVDICMWATGGSARQSDVQYGVAFCIFDLDSLQVWRIAYGVVVEANDNVGKAGLG